MKDMISSVRSSRERPRWINETIWKTMVEYWDTDEAQERSEIYEKNRMSDRNGLGPHIHLAGPRSYQQVQEQMEEEMGRPVTLGEVFIKTHTRKDGSFVDRKAEIIVENYEKKLQGKMSGLDADASTVSDGASRHPELTAEEYTAIFLEATEKDSRGAFYGLGSLKDNIPNGFTSNRKEPGESCSSFSSLQDQLKEAQLKIKEQAEEHARVMAEQKGKLHQLSMVEEYLRKTDPAFQDFIASHSATPSASAAHVAAPSASAAQLAAATSPSS